MPVRKGGGIGGGGANFIHFLYKVSGKRSVHGVDQLD